MAREQILAIAKSVGVSVGELVGGSVRAKSGPVAMQYRNQQIHPNSGPVVVGSRSGSWHGLILARRWIRQESELLGKFEEAA